GESVVLSGKNANGKSSVLNAVEAALLGKSAAPAMPVHEGAESSTVVVVLGDENETKLRVTKTFEGGKEKLLVENAEGVRQGAPQRVLDSLRGAVGFDPLSFAYPPGTKTDAAADKERLRMLAQVAPLPIDLDAWKEERADAYRSRTEANRVLKQAEARIPPKRTTPMPQRVDVAAMMERLQEAEKAGRRREWVKDEIEGRVHQQQDLKAEIEQLQRRLADLQAEEAESRAELETLSVPDVSGLRDTIARASEQNDAAATAEAEERSRVQAEADLEGAQMRVNELNADIDRLDTQKAEALASVTLPADGLSISEDGVLLNGRPFSAASTSEKISASVRVAAAMNPKLRVAIIRDGNALDRDAMDALLAFAKDADLQLWVERVATDTPGAVEIVDGTVRDAVTA
ncbi:MAG: hypothetical protein ACPGWS_08945, partial [Solirubrobacterales bacterium]